MQDIVAFMQHHGALSILLIVVLVFLFILEFIRLKRGTTQLSCPEAVRLINRQNAVVVDIRSTEAFINGHIVDAISLPSNEIPEKSKKLEKYKSQPIILVCATGIDSPRTADKLKALGLNVHVLAGGIQAWRNADLPLVKGK